VAKKKGRSGAERVPAAKAELVSDGLIAELDRLAGVLQRNGLTEVELQRGDLFVRLSSGAPAAVAMPAAAARAATPAAAPQKLDTATETSDGNVSYITSPFVGTYYRAPNPEAAPFVDEGTKFKKGQALCIVEAMKLMNEIEAEVDGVIVQILVENGQPVEYGEPLFKIRQA
jgi:acetyl-CoA carboxylase biotin carboxyl carrier protein